MHLQESSQGELDARLFKLLEDFALERREVVLASGQKSSIYLDCRQVYFRGEAHFLIGELFYQKMLEIEKRGTSFGASGGMAMGSIPLSMALSAAAFRRGRELPGCTVRKEVKDHGMAAKIEGNKCLAKDMRVLLLEDVVTTASSALAAVLELRKAGLIIDSMFALVDREQGGRESLAAAGIELHALYSLKDFVEA